MCRSLFSRTLTHAPLTTIQYTQPHRYTGASKGNARGGQSQTLLAGVATLCSKWATAVVTSRETRDSGTQSAVEFAAPILVQGSVLLLSGAGRVLEEGDSSDNMSVREQSYVLVQTCAEHAGKAVLGGSVSQAANCASLVAVLFRLLDSEDERLASALHGALGGLRTAYQENKDSDNGSSGSSGAVIADGGVGVHGRGLEEVIIKARASEHSRNRLAALQWARAVHGWGALTLETLALLADDSKANVNAAVKKEFTILRSKMTTEKKEKTDNDGESVSLSALVGITTKLLARGDKDGRAEKKRRPLAASELFRTLSVALSRRAVEVLGSDPDDAPALGTLGGRVWTQLLQVEAKVRTEVADSNAVEGKGSESTEDKAEKSEKNEEEELLLKLIHSFDKVSESGYATEGLASAAAELLRYVLLSSNSASARAAARDKIDLMMGWLLGSNAREPILENGNSSHLLHSGNSGYVHSSSSSNSSSSTESNKSSNNGQSLILSEMVAQCIGICSLDSTDVFMADVRSRLTQSCTEEGVEASILSHRRAHAARVYCCMLEACETRMHYLICNSLIHESKQIQKAFFGLMHTEFALPIPILENLENLESGNGGVDGKNGGLERMRLELRDPLQTYVRATMAGAYTCLLRHEIFVNKMLAHCATFNSIEPPYLPSPPGVVNPSVPVNRKLLQWANWALFDSEAGFGQKEKDGGPGGCVGVLASVCLRAVSAYSVFGLLTRLPAPVKEHASFVSDVWSLLNKKQLWALGGVSVQGRGVTSFAVAEALLTMACCPRTSADPAPTNGVGQAKPTLMQQQLESVLPTICGGEFMGHTPITITNISTVLEGGSQGVDEDEDTLSAFIASSACDFMPPPLRRLLTTADEAARSMPIDADEDDVEMDISSPSSISSPYSVPVAASAGGNTADAAGRVIMRNRQREGERGTAAILLLVYVRHSEIVHTAGDGALVPVYLKPGDALPPPVKASPQPPSALLSRLAETLLLLVNSSNAFTQDLSCLGLCHLHERAKTLDDNQKQSITQSQKEGGRSVAEHIAHEVITTLARERRAATPVGMGVSRASDNNRSSSNGSGTGASNNGNTTNNNNNTNNGNNNDDTDTLAAAAATAARELGINIDENEARGAAGKFKSKSKSKIEGYIAIYCWHLMSYGVVH